MRAFLGYLTQWRKAHDRETIFCNYVADALRLITENTARYAGGQYLTNRYADLIAPKKKPPKQTGQQIAGNIISRLHE